MLSRPDISHEDQQEEILEAMDLLDNYRKTIGLDDWVFANACSNFFASSLADLTPKDRRKALNDYVQHIEMSNRISQE